MEMQIASSLRLICRIYIDKRAMDFLFVAKTTGNGVLQSSLARQRISMLLYGRQYVNDGHP